MDQKDLDSILKYPKITIVNAFLETGMLFRRAELFFNLRSFEIKRLLQEIHELNEAAVKYDVSKPKQQIAWLEAVKRINALHKQVDRLMAAQTAALDEQGGALDADHQ